MSVSIRIYSNGVTTRLIKISLRYHTDQRTLTQRSWISKVYIYVWFSPNVRLLKKVYMYSNKKIETAVCCSFYGIS